MGTSGVGDVEANEPSMEEEMMKKRATATAEEEDEQECAAYRHLLSVLEKAEDKRLSGAAMVVMAIEIVVVLGLTAALACTLTLDDMKANRLRGLRMWQYVLMAIILFAGLSIVRWITTFAFWLLMRCRFALHRDAGYFLREMKTSIDVSLWFSGVLFFWYVWFRSRLRHIHGEVSVVVAHQLTRFLIAACLGAVLWVGKNALFFWLEADLHYRKLCDRITRTIRQLHVLQILHKFGVWKFLHHAKARRRLQNLLDSYPKDALHKDKAKLEENKILKKEGDNICKELMLVKRERVPVWILRRLCEEYMNQIFTKPLPITKEIVQDPDKLMDQAVKLFREMKGINQDAICDHDNLDLADMQARYEVEPENLKLFFKSISGENVKPDTKPDSQQHNQENMRCGFSSLVSSVCGNCSGKSNIVEKDGIQHSYKPEEFELEVGRDEFLSWAVVAYRNCWGLQSTLKSSEQIIVKLNRVMIVFVLILALIIWLLLSEIVDTAQIALLFSPLIAAKFIFSESTKNMFDGLIFALAMHPFGPGDRVIIKEMELLVTEISILTTTFYNYQTGEELVYPNSELATIEIINLENNPDQSDQLEFSIHKSMPLEDIRDLEIRIQMSLNERIDAFKTEVVKAEMGLDNIKMIVHFNYVGSYLTSKVKAFHRSEMLSMIMLLLKKMPAKVYNPSLLKVYKPPYYTVDITLAKKVKKMKQLDIIETAVTKSLKHRYDKNFRVVFNYVNEKRVMVIFFVWKNGQQLSVKELDMHCATISHYLQIQGNGETQDKAISKSCLQVTQVKVQPMACIVEIMSGDNNVIEVKDNIRRYLCENYYPYDFDLIKVNEEQHNVKKKNHNMYEIHSWIQFPHNMEEEKQQLDVEQIMKDYVDKLSSLKTLNGICTAISVKTRQKPMVCIAEIIFSDNNILEEKEVNVLENSIKGYLCEKYYTHEFEAKFNKKNSLLEIHCWILPVGNTEEGNMPLDLDQIINIDNLKNILELRKLKDVIV